MINDPIQKLALLFAISEVLRIASEWIHETMDDLKNLVEDFNASTEQISTNFVRSNWQTVLSHQAGMGRELLESIEMTTNQVKSLKDFVCLQPSKKIQPIEYILMCAITTTLVYLTLNSIGMVFAADWPRFG